MTTDVASALATVHTLQSILLSFDSIGVTDYHFHTDTDTSSLYSKYDYIVIGSGCGGSVVASRLSENSNRTVLLLEAGGIPPIESVLPGMFTLEPSSAYDYNYTSDNDGYATQNLVDYVAGLTAGKMSGGSSSLDHMIYVRGNKYDYANWEEITGDSSWNYDNLLQYFKKLEDVLDQEILDDYSDSHGTSGPLKLSKQPSSENVPILAAYEEMGCNVISDINNVNETVGCLEPQLTIANTFRQSAPMAYLSRALNRKNLHFKYNAQATKVNFDSNNTAISVDILLSTGDTITISANLEIIVSAGAIGSVKLLQNSGVGPSDVLENVGVDVVADLPVGKNLTDHVAAVVAYTLDKTNSTSVTNYHEFPAPMTTVYASLDSTEKPTYQAINLVFPQSSSGLLQLLAHVFKYNEDITQEIYAVNKERKILIVVLNVLKPHSRGEVYINSTDSSAAPIVNLGLLSNETDLSLLAQSLKHFNTIVNTTYFSSINSTMVNLNLTNCNDIEKYSLEYFECYGKEMSSTMWHYSGTGALGSVTNSDLTVKDTNNLRLCDGSVVPDIPSGNIMASIYVTSEKASDMIKSAHS